MASESWPARLHNEVFCRRPQGWLPAANAALFPEPKFPLLQVFSRQSCVKKRLASAYLMGLGTSAGTCRLHPRERNRQVAAAHHASELWPSSHCGLLRALNIRHGEHLHFFGVLFPPPESWPWL